jgi:uncharacterized protein (DUF433 family)
MHRRTAELDSKSHIAAGEADYESWRQDVLDRRISADLRVMTGKPVVRGTHIPVEQVLLHLADNPSLEDLRAAYPRLTSDDVRICVERRLGRPTIVN